ncbi:hypothetical protein ACLOJK_010217 [Asimina triloba]
MTINDIEPHPFQPNPETFQKSNPTHLLLPPSSFPFPSNTPSPHTSSYSAAPPHLPQCPTTKIPPSSKKKKTMTTMMMRIRTRRSPLHASRPVSRVESRTKKMMLGEGVRENRKKTMLDIQKEIATKEEGGDAVVEERERENGKPDGNHLHHREWKTHRPCCVCMIVAGDFVEEENLRDLPTSNFQSLSIKGSMEGEILDDDELWQEVGTGRTDGKEKSGEEREGSG